MNDNTSTISIIDVAIWYCNKERMNENTAEYLDEWNLLAMSNEKAKF